MTNTTALTQRGISGLMRFVTEEERDGGVDAQYYPRYRWFECPFREEVTASDVSL